MLRAAPTVELPRGGAHSVRVSHLRMPGAECTPYKGGDTLRRGCSRSFCSPAKASVVCRWCKCKACGLCAAHDAAPPPPPATARAEAREHSTLAILNRYKQPDLELAYLKDAPIPYLVIDAGRVPGSTIGLDAVVYLSFVIEQYDNLPKWLLFMHAHQYHWHHPAYSQVHGSRATLIHRYTRRGRAAEPRSRRR